MVTYQIGTDIGGTHTDTVILTPDGEQYIAKAPSTPDDFSVGVIDSLEVACDEIGVSLEELLENTERFVNGSTVATNTIAELQGERTGVITTKGFEDTLKIARSPRKGQEFDLHKQTGPPEIVGKELIEGVPERVDYKGENVIPLKREEAERAVDRLVEQEVDTIAVCFLWSFRNETNEKLIGEVIEDKYPDLHYSLSHEIFPSIREYERMTTTVFNSYAGPSVVKYTENLRDRLKEQNLDYPPVIMHSEGGYMTVEEAKDQPVKLVSSGPAAGVIGANELGKNIGLTNIITADMGGTSFDTSMIQDNDIRMRNRARIGEFDTGLNLVDVEAIGSGGGSIGWIDERGQPNVGPESAGADPGPACYGLGGKQPTVTDAALSLGFLNPDYFLSGRETLSVEAAQKALREHIAEPLDQDLDEAASGVMTIAIAKMSNAVRSVSIEKGYDPRNFTMMAFGGTSPLFATWICEDLGIDEIVVPYDAASFSAHGLLEADHKRSYQESYHAILNEDSIVQLNDIFESLESVAITDFEKEGYKESEIEIQRKVDLRFSGQASEMSLALKRRQYTATDAETISEQFIEEYETLYGEGTAWEEAEIEVQSVKIDAVIETETPPLKSTKHEEYEKGNILKETRELLLPRQGEYREVSVFDGERVKAGFEYDEPAIIEKPYTTVFIPPGASLRVDDYDNIIINRNEN